MVVLSPNFTVLASLSALAVVSMIPTGAEAVALTRTPERSSTSKGDSFTSHREVNTGSRQGRNGQNSFSPDAKGQDASSSSDTPIPALSLPPLQGRGTFGVEHSPSTMEAIDKVSFLVFWMSEG